MMKQRKQVISLLLLVLLAGLAAPTVEAADSTLLHTSSLQSFFAELGALREGKDTVISIVHLGDSHIQAGHFSGTVMRLLQREFGCAGRGWIAPFKLCRTNEPDDYFITSVAKDWVAGRCNQRTKKCPIGIGGIGLQNASPSINLDIHIAPVNGVGYSFNQAVFYRSEHSMPMLPAGAGKEWVKTSFSGSAAAPGVLADTFRIFRQTDTLLLHSTRRKQGTDQLLPAASFSNIYYGLSLTNGKAGILYHSIGVNGAMYVDYTDEAYVRQLALLRPSLLILSLGTNETFGRHFSTAEFSAQIKAFLSCVKKQMPHTAILLTTPPGCYKRVRVKKKRIYVRNDNTQWAAKAILNVARTEGVACWDLYRQEAGAMARDHVHFTKEGYQKQGAQLFRALMNSYNQSNNTHAAL